MISAISNIISLYSSHTYKSVITEYGKICWTFPTGKHSFYLAINRVNKLMFYNHRNLRYTFCTRINTIDTFDKSYGLVYLPRWYVTYSAESFLL